MDAPVGLLSLAVGMFGMGAVTAQTMNDAAVADLIVQGTGVALALAVGMWLLRRYDARSDAAQDRYDKLLAEERRLLIEEREAHAETRRLLEEALHRDE